MANFRFTLTLVVAVLCSGSLGCSPGSAVVEEPSLIGGNAETAAAPSDQPAQNIRWWRDESVVSELGLSDDQIHAVEELMAVTLKDAQKGRQRERHLSLMYLRALSQEPYDPILVNRTGEQLIEVLSNEHRRRIESVHALRDIVTRDQWTKLWEVAPQAVRIGRVRIARGPSISVSSDPDASQSPLP